MKPLVPLLAVSVAANAALVAAVLLRQPAPVPSAAAMAGVRSGPTTPEQNLRAALASGDAAALAAAGCTPEIARALAVGRAYHRQQERLRALRAPTDRTIPFWRREFGIDGYSGMPREARAEMSKIQREYQEQLHLAGEDDPMGFGGSASLQTFLPAEMREKLRRIERDYDEMNGDIFNESGNLPLASDKERYKLLQTEKERDIAALLGPQLFAQYQARTSNSAWTVRNRYGSAINSEEEYNAVYALQKSFDDQFGPNKGSAVVDPAAHREAETKLQQEVSSFLGPERVQVLLRENDPDYRTLTALTQRLDLPATTPNAILAMRAAYAAESIQINNNTDLPEAERSAQLKALGARAQADLEKTLGLEGGQAFAGRAGWLRTLKNGIAFSTAPNPRSPLSPSITSLPAVNK